MSPKRFFRGKKAPLDISTYPTPAYPDNHSNTRTSKNKKAPSTKHTNSCASAITLEGRLRQATLILHPGFGCNITLDSSILPKNQQYMITIGSFPTYSCPYFKEMETKAFGKRGQWANCKHLYFVLLSYVA
jgi:hypothetical protein